MTKKPRIRNTEDFSTPEKTINIRIESIKNKDFNTARNCYQNKDFDGFIPTSQKYRITAIEKISKLGTFSKPGDVLVTVESKVPGVGVTYVPFILRNFDGKWKIIDSPEFDDGDFPPDGSAPMYDPTFQPSNQ